MFEKVVFAGGGHRCWWQAGFWDAVTGEIELHPRVIGAVSAGAATVCLLYANDARRALAWYERELAGVRSNVNWLNLVRRDRRLMPHAAIQRKALRALLGGDHFRQLLWRAPEIRVQFTRLPPGTGPARAVFAGLVGGRIGKRQASDPRVAALRFGFTREVKRVQDCRSERELVDLLVASSASPPFTPLESIDGQPCMDGGLFGHVPVDVVDDVPGQTLVLMTRRDDRLAPVFARAGRVYVQPSEPVAATSWDCTSPARYLRTYELGRRDGDNFLKTFALGRHRDPEHFAGLFLDDAVGTFGRPAATAAVAEPALAAEPAEPAEPADATPAVPEHVLASMTLGQLLGKGPGPAPDYGEATDAGTADDFKASQPSASAGQVRSGRSFRASRI